MWHILDTCMYVFGRGVAILGTTSAVMGISSSTNDST